MAMAPFEQSPGIGCCWDLHFNDGNSIFNTNSLLMITRTIPNTILFCQWYPPLKHLAEHTIKPFIYWSNHYVFLHWSNNWVNNLAMKHVILFHNHTSNYLFDLAPMELLAKTKANQCNNLWTCVWGCLLYDLDSKLQDGKRFLSGTSDQVWA